MEAEDLETFKEQSAIEYKEGQSRFETTQRSVPLSHREYTQKFVTFSDFSLTE
jgi:hypothetical protein